MDAIKRIGRYTVPVEVFADVTAELKLVVAPEGEELPPQEELDELEAQETAAAAEVAAAAAAADLYEDAPAEPARVEAAVVDGDAGGRRRRRRAAGRAAGGRRARGRRSALAPVPHSRRPQALPRACGRLPTGFPQPAQSLWISG